MTNQWQVTVKQAPLAVHSPRLLSKTSDTNGPHS
jgi:hypothetical protein